MVGTLAVARVSADGHVGQIMDVNVEDDGDGDDGEGTCVMCLMGDGCQC